jgi:predicted TPR repeat methyltransferase
VTDPAKRYDRAYFDRFYRRPRTRVHSPDDVLRKVHHAVSAAEFVLERPIESVLDIGAGEGAWQPILRRMRPQATYLGVEPSDYAVRRHGRRRNIRQGTFDDLPAAGIRGRFDLIVCADVMNYLSSRALRAGLGQIARHLRGVAYLEIYTEEDELDGDLDGIDLRPARWYRRLLRDAGFTSCGLHCYAGRAAARNVVAMERGW